MNYYNDNDPKVCEWLRCLIRAGLIPPGDVDDRSIADVQPTDLNGYTQCHFFAGIGGWAYALALAGWPTARPVWTGSCPCQPFSAAGKRRGTEDSRHLWPEFRRLIAECKPPTVFGEQVASKAGREWLAGVRADLEEVGYAVGAADLCAASAGAPHIRQRLYWVADATDGGREHELWEGGVSEGKIFGDSISEPCVDVANVRVADSIVQRLEGHGWDGADGCEPRRDGADATGPVTASCGDIRTFWDDSILIPCRDPKRGTVYRRAPAEPAFQPLAHGVPGRVVQLRGLGNAIVPSCGAEFIKAFMETR